MKNILLIVNPVAGRMHSRSSLFDIVNEFCKKNISVSVAVTQYRAHGTELAEHAAENGFDTVAAVGGDGTLNEVITGLLKSGHPLPLGYIPAGSTNDFARTLDLSMLPAEAAERITEGNRRTIDIGCFNDERYFSYIASFGAFSSTSYEAPQELKNTLGHFAYILEGIKSINETKSHRVKIEADGKTYQDNYLFCSVSNTSSIGGMIKLKPSIFNLNDGLMEVLLIKKPQTAMDLNLILSGIASSDFTGNMFEFFRASNITFSLNKHVDWTLDGEKAEGSGEVHIKTLKSAINIYR